VESNWRWNVFAKGMSYSTWRLAARLNIPGEWYVVDFQRFGARWIGLFQVTAPGQLPVMRSQFPWAPGNGSFPFGQDVLPD